MVHPCCGNSLQRAVKIMAIVDIVLGAISLILWIVALVSAISYLASKNQQDNSWFVALAVIIIRLLITILDIIMAVLLLKGAERNDYSRCGTWRMYTCIVVAIKIIVLIINASSGHVVAANILLAILFILYRIYMIWVVHAFMEELKSGTNTRIGEV